MGQKSLNADIGGRGVSNRLLSLLADSHRIARLTMFLLGLDLLHSTIVSCSGRVANCALHQANLEERTH